MQIESVNNPQVKAWMKLKEKKYRDSEDKFLIEGDHLLREALKMGEVTAIISNNPAYKEENIPFYLVSDAILKKLSMQVSFSDVVAIVKKLPSKEIDGNVALLDNIQDPGNLGAIIRSALAFNIKTIIMSNDTVDLYNPKVIRSSEGMMFHLNFIKGDLEKQIISLKEEGYKIYGTDVNTGTNLKDLTFWPKNGIIIGNEGQGMKLEYQKYCDTLINIPINKSCESLNASVAASIIFYEMQK